MSDEAAISTLRHFVDLPSPHRVHDSITALHPLNHEKIHGLLNALDDEDPNLRLLVIEILAELDPLEATLPALLKALDDPDRIIRIAAVDPIARFREEGLRCSSDPRELADR